MSMNKTFYNASGCKDPTAGEAIGKVAKEEAATDKRAKDSVHICKRFLDIRGFELIGRIKIRDRKTSKEYL